MGDLELGEDGATQANYMGKGEEGLLHGIHSLCDLIECSLHSAYDVRETGTRR